MRKIVLRIGQYILASEYDIIFFECTMIYILIYVSIAYNQKLIIDTITFDK